MYNAIKILCAALLVCLLTCCAGNDRRDSAVRLLDEAREAAARKDYSTAINLLDTLDKSYRDCLAQRRLGTRLRSEALRDMTLDSISINDTRLTELQRRVDALQGQFRHVDVAGTDGYDVYAPAMKSWNLNRTGVQPRIDSDGYFFIAVNLVGRTIGLNSISACGASTLPSASVAVEGSEIMNINQENATPLIEALAGARPPVKMSLDGSRGKASLTLDAEALESFTATWHYAIARQELRLNLIRRERLERQLSRLRDTLANLPTADETSSDN